MVIKNVLRVCFFHFQKWRGNWNVIITFLLSGILMFLLTEKIVDFGVQEHTVIQIMEPFIWALDEKQSILVASLILMILFLDLPYTDGSIPYFLVRTNRKVWGMGQLLYMGLTTLIYVGYMVVVGMIFSARIAFIGNKWSETAAMLGFSRYSDFLEIPAQLKTMQRISPYECAGMIIILLFLYIYLSILIMTYVTYLSGKKAGICSMLLFQIIGNIVNADFVSQVFHLSEIQRYKADIICAWCSPLSHVTFHMHNFGFDELPSMKSSVAVLSGLIVTLFVLIMIRMKRYNFYFSGTESTGK